MFSTWIVRLLKQRGIEVRRIVDAPPSDMEADFLSIYAQAKPYTMTSIERSYALYKSIEYVVRRGVPGDVVECGVWKGGSSMIAGASLIHFGDMSRKLYLYDTFLGMSEPTEEDGDIAQKKWRMMKRVTHNAWCYSSLDEVAHTLAGIKYPENQIHFVKGKVEDTIPSTMPERISLLRLDTDWYASTLHELTHLFPRVSPGGVIIIDDYGHWEGARKAVDEFFSTYDQQYLFHRVDKTGRVIVKC